MASGFRRKLSTLDSPPRRPIGRRRTLEPPPDELPPDDELCWIRGSTFVYSCRKLQNAQVSTTCALPLLLVVAGSITVSLGRLRPVAGTADTWRSP